MAFSAEKKLCAPRLRAAVLGWGTVAHYLWLAAARIFITLAP